jgi:hypothetical protein
MNDLAILKIFSQIGLQIRVQGVTFVPASENHIFAGESTSKKDTGYSEGVFPNIRIQ